MVFNSWEFIIFLIFVYVVYTLLPRYKWQNWFLLVGSYYFYAAWDWRFLFLILGTTIVNFFAGSVIGSNSEQRYRKLALIISLVVSLGLLGFLKYYNFFLESLDALVTFIGLSTDMLRLNIVLPVGISFYTFQVISYTVDIYRRKITPTRDFLDFALFVAFFPQLVAGPIERAKRLLPQISQERTIDISKFGTGIWLVFWGLYKKVVVADNLAVLVGVIFSDSASATFLMVYLGALAFAFQIYCDFSAYSDIARGCARILGFDLMRNFNLPYFAKDPQDFWRRWHISLSTWLRDYLYIPLGGNRKSDNRTSVNLFLTMLLGGLWHGASWNFIWWGSYHGLLLVVHRMLTIKRKVKDISTSWWTLFVKITAMYHFTLFGWLIFRANRRVMSDGWYRDDSFNQIIELITSFSNGFGFDFVSLDLFMKILIYTLPLIIFQWFQYIKDDHYFILKYPIVQKAVVITIFGFTMIIWGVQTGESFIYFQF